LVNCGRNGMNGPARTHDWPPLMVDEWTATRDTLHMWTQIVGKIRMTRLPLLNHWWQVTLYVSHRGLTTGAVPYVDAVFDIEFELVQAHRVMTNFRAAVIGKASPVQFFWGAMDLACTRFSGRPAPTHPGGAPNCPDAVMVDGYSRELSSCGFWPRGGKEGAFYCYAYPSRRASPAPALNRAPPTTATNMENS
jgi:hypothetical protein